MGSAFRDLVLVPPETDRNESPRSYGCVCIDGDCGYFHRGHSGNEVCDRFVNRHNIDTTAATISNELQVSKCILKIDR